MSALVHEVWRPGCPWSPPKAIAFNLFFLIAVLEGCGRSGCLSQCAAQRCTTSKRKIGKVPCLDSLSGYWPVECTTRAERLATPHAVHANTTRLAALQNDVVALRALDVLCERRVTLPQVRGDMFALAVRKAVFRPQGLAILARLGNLPQSTIVVA